MEKGPSEMCTWGPFTTVKYGPRDPYFPVVNGLLVVPVDGHPPPYI